VLPAAMTALSSLLPISTSAARRRRSRSISGRRCELLRRTRPDPAPISPGSATRLDRRMDISVSFSTARNVAFIVEGLVAMVVWHDARGEGVVGAKWIDPSVGKPQGAKMGFMDSDGAVPTRDERKTDRVSMMNQLTQAPQKLGIGCGRCRTRRILRKVARWYQPAFWTGNTDPSFIPKEQSPKQSTRYQKLSFELRNSPEDKLWLPPCPLVRVYNLESTHDLVGKGRRHERWGSRRSASKQLSTRSSHPGGHGCAADTERSTVSGHLVQPGCDTRLRPRRTHRRVAWCRKVLSGMRQEW
jgi:hypothetical protein